MVHARRADCDDGVPSAAVIVASAVIHHTISDRFTDLGSGKQALCPQLFLFSGQFFGQFSFTVSDHFGSRRSMKDRTPSRASALPIKC